MSFDRKMSPQHSTWQNGTVTQNSSTATGKCAGAALQFAPGTTSVEVTVAISLVSVAGARANLEAEAQNKSFETCRQDANTAWNEALGVVALGAGDTTSGNDSNARKLYTALYHAQMAPTHVHDFDGKYRGMDGAVHQLQHPATDVYMSDMSIWDIHRTELPLLNLLQPRQGLAVVSSLALMASEGGDIPRWPLADVYTGCMIGNHANAIVLDTAVKAGLASLPEQTWHGLLNAMVAAASNASEPHVARPGLLECDKLGYCPQDKVEGGSAYTLAYAFDDWSISRMAALLNESGVEEHFGATAQRFKNVWNEKKLRFCPRHSDGSWECAVDPELNTWLAQGGKFWTEGNEAQWRWFVPGDPAGLVALFPSPAKFVSELDKFMTEPHSNPSTFLPNGGYWAGNEPDILAPWLFNFAGRQDRTQYHTRWLMDHRYGLGGDGLPGNDDFGTLSSWFAFAAMGLYPLTGSAGYIVGSPLFEKVVLPGRNATILAHNQSSSNVYVSSLSLNGVTLQGDEARFISHAALQGARLEFWMSATPPTLL
jgi:predicted alpha-1,2-mannosidase